LVERFLNNPLGPMFCLLSNFRIALSTEAIELVKSKSSGASPREERSPKKKARVSKRDDNEFPSINQISAPQSLAIDIDDNPPSTPTGNKRNFSDGSLGTLSTETTPKKINHPEANTQALQNCLVETLMYRLWLGGAKVKWAEGRNMYLDYRPYCPKVDCLMVGQTVLLFAVV
jgi:hypothetical protein